MRTNRYITLFLFITILSSFAGIDKYSLEFSKLQKYELLALKSGSIGKTYIYDLTNKKDCNKTSIKYLGIIKTKNGKQYKIISSFFVFSTASTCHGTSNIKIYDMKNQFIGKYDVGMPYELPTKITENKFICWNITTECDSRKGFSINFEKGLPKSFFLPCSKNGGDECYFSNE
jgi:hypothetical protein